MAEAPGVLGEIAAAKQAELAARLDGVSIESLRASARPSCRSLVQALARPGARFILEIKKASPSSGAIRPGADAAALARGYAGVADALSVLTDARFFGGSLGDLVSARRAFDGPILAKDFFLDPRQVIEARVTGADAVLVMLSLVDDRLARELVAEARHLGMDALLEVHDETQMARALALGAPLIGINNRDLGDLSVDLGTTERLARLAPDRLLVAESGIAGRGDVERLAGSVDAFLVGTSLMRCGDPAKAARELIFGRVKLCGLTRGEDFEAARAAIHAGLVFVPESPRAVPLRQAMTLAPLHPRTVGVFRDAPVDEVGDIATLLGLAAVQLHGDEDASYARALARRLPGECEIWKVLPVGERSPSSFDAADRLVFDNGPGGTGRTFDWALVTDHPELSRGIVAGGIGPHNAPAARRLGAYAIDVGSAVEVGPGVKAPERIAALFDALRPQCRQQEFRACA